MMIVIETDYVDVDLLKRHLRDAQNESDEAQAESPEDYPEGYGTLALGTTHTQINARVVGILHTFDVAGFSFHEIEPVRTETE